MMNNDKLHVVNNCINYHILLRGFHFLERFDFVFVQNECKCCNDNMAGEY